MATTYSSIFGALTLNVQARINAASKLQKDLFDKAYYPTYLDWDTPSIGLNFEEIMGKYNISIAAATVGDGSKEPVLGVNGASTYANKVFKHAITRPLTIAEYRKVLAILDSKALTDAQVKQQLVDIMWGTVEDVVNGVKGKIDMIFLGALFNEGKFTFDETTNPEGGVRGLIDYNMPAANIATADTPWTEANIATVDPFEDLSALIAGAEDKVPVAKLLIAPSKLNYLLRCPKMRAAVYGTDKAAAPLTLQILNQFMESNSLPVFEKVTRKVNIKSGNTINSYSPVNAKNIVAVPAGKIGTIKNAYADSELRQENGVTYSLYDRIRVSQWGVGESQGVNGVEYTKAESLSLPVITEIDGIFTLKTEE